MNKELSHKMSFQEILEIWQHFANLGGHDKDRMVTILTFLTPVLTGIIGFAYTADTDESLRKVAAIAGCTTAAIAILTVLMYAGYANRNWKIADEIAEANFANVTLKGLDKSRDSFGKPLLKFIKPKQHTCPFLGPCLQTLSECLSKPHNPRNSLAPIFMLFFLLSVILFFASLYIFWINILH